ncbi:tRNA modification GTPase [Bythopirellula polymerisocia]|uniref:tRNA modification GTPase MnmE n=1 Tax=Bythopirellula polymerisocia TaxID=2528003 RepID=A0A5C6C9L2_9BACT|nr:tRNA modification GTPase [Bythopirellula polymerisocia]TWU20842.1 tRNA modification GTPase MnmE [Bythopirellula polymerisocia]
MVPDITDTIAAIGTARGGAARGMIRLSGPRMLDCLAGCFEPSEPAFRLKSLNTAQLVAGILQLNTATVVYCEVFLWPSERSYTRQPCAELHTFGSSPLLEASLESLCLHGARIAEPGEFTLRACLAGRLDLTQAEAVLGIIDASSDDSLQTALVQLAGGLSQPLTELRETLLVLLAHLEAGLDFVEEDIEFISAGELSKQLTAAVEMVEAVVDQLTTRNQPLTLPRVVLVGKPNAGKSSLFNALLNECGASREKVRALVSEQAGTTRDFLSASVDMGGLKCELIDTAGSEANSEVESIGSFAQEMTATQRKQADCCVLCLDATEERIRDLVDNFIEESQSTHWNCLALTKCDLLQHNQTAIPSHPRVLFCSSLTGAGVNELRTAIAATLGGSEKLAAGSVATTAARCSESLRSARDSLRRALETLSAHGGEELVAADLRTALDNLGRVVGTVYTDDVLDRIFSQFCIGK